MLYRDRARLLLLVSPLVIACGDNINVAPDTPDFVLSTSEDTPLRIELELSDANGDEVEFSIVSEPENGTVDPQQPIYTPAQDFNGRDRLTYIASDGILISTGQITIDVVPINDPPTISAVVDLQTTMEEPLVIPFGVNDIDTEVADLRTAASSADETIVPTANMLLGGEGPNRDVTITPIARGIVDLTLFVLDGDDLSSEGFALEVINAAPITVDDSYDVTTGVQLVVAAAAGVLANDSDVEGDPVSVVEQAAAPTALGGTVNLLSDGSFTYDEPGGGIPGQTDTFTYVATDSMDTSTATVSLVVN